MAGKTRENQTFKKIIFQDESQDSRGSYFRAYRQKNTLMHLLWLPTTGTT
jgi:hypothetical protein